MQTSEKILCIHTHVHMYTHTHTHINTQAHRSCQLKFLEKEEAQKREESDISKCKREDKLRTSAVGVGNCTFIGT